MTETCEKSMTKVGINEDMNTHKWLGMQNNTEGCLDTFSKKKSLHESAGVKLRIKMGATMFS